MHLTAIVDTGWTGDDRVKEGHVDTGWTGDDRVKEGHVDTGWTGDNSQGGSCWHWMNRWQQSRRVMLTLDEQVTTESRRVMLTLDEQVTTESRRVMLTLDEQVMTESRRAVWMECLLTTQLFFNGWKNKLTQDFFLLLCSRNCVGVLVYVAAVILVF